MTTATLIDLPWEIIVHDILPRVNLKTCFLLRQVCSDFATIVTLYFESLRRINLSTDELSPIIPRHVLEILLRGNAICRTFVLNIRFKIQFKNADETVEDCICDAILPQFFDRAGQLQHIDLSGSNSISSFCLKVIAFCCKMLESLNLSSCHWIEIKDVCDIMSSCSGLLSLNLSSLWSVDDNALKAILTSGQQLRQLTLVNVYSISDRSLYELSKSCPKLQELNIIGCRRISDTGIRSLAECSDSLSELKLSQCPAASEGTLEILRKRGIYVDLSPTNSINSYYWPLINIEC